MTIAPNTYVVYLFLLGIPKHLQEEVDRRFMQKHVGSLNNSYIKNIKYDHAISKDQFFKEFLMIIEA